MPLWIEVTVQFQCMFDFHLLTLHRAPSPIKTIYALPSNLIVHSRNVWREEEENGKVYIEFFLRDYLMFLAAPDSMIILCAIDIANFFQCLNPTPLYFLNCCYWIIILNEELNTTAGRRMAMLLMLRTGSWECWLSMADLIWNVLQIYELIATGVQPPNIK